jgi:hypothetical protein
MPWCDSCFKEGALVPATTRSFNPKYSRYLLCDECASKYDLMFLTDDSRSEAKRFERASVLFASLHGGGGVFKLKYGGKHYIGCVCDACGAFDGKHARFCACPYCGGKEGKHNPECRCPQCFGEQANHNASCECPVCHRLG